MPTGRADELCALVDEPKRSELAALPELSALLDQQLADARAAWPTVTIEEVDYLRHLADKVRSRSDELAVDVIRTMPAADLYLAAGCCAGDPAAIAAFHDAIMPVVRPALVKLGLADSTIDETEQRVLVLTLVGDPDRPAIAGYSGRGRLRSFVRSIAVRTGRRLAGANDVTAVDDLDQLSAAVDDPELELLRNRYREQVRDALAAAMATLDERQRNVLRQYYVDGLTIDQLAAVYRVARATTARWVVAARSSVLGATRDHLRAQLGATTTEIESILRLVRSQLELSL